MGNVGFRFRSDFFEATTQEKLQCCDVILHFMCSNNCLTWVTAGSFSEGEKCDQAGERVGVKRERNFGKLF